jgi:hypothetical protein
VPCRPSQPALGLGCGGRALSSPVALDRTAGADAGSGPSPLVLRDTTGPYEYAVLRAESATELRTWLDGNRYFVPGTSDQALAPYIRPGAYLLALKLRAGQTAGDLRPIVLNYTSDYPMIPLILTSATAVPNMGIQVYVLGAHRAIPRNYHHVVLNELKVDWSTGENYGPLVTAAVALAPDKHGFVTEFSGSPAPVRQALDTSVYGTVDALAAQTRPWDFVAWLVGHGFSTPESTVLSDQLLALLEPQLPYPKGLAALGITPPQFYADLRTYLSAEYQAAHPEAYAGWPGTRFEPVSLAQSVWEAIAQPVIDAKALLAQHTTLTRLYTTLSPQDMTVDPVFGFNASLPPVDAVRRATRTLACEGNETRTAAQDGFSAPDAKIEAMPAARRIELMREEGEPEVVSELMQELDASGPKTSGCQVADGALMVGLGLAWLLLRRRRLE